MTAMLGLVAALAMPAPTAHADTPLALKLTDTGQRDYYCTATFKLDAPEGVAFQDVNGFFYVFVGDEQVGRSKGASFRFDDGQRTASATFETPNAPCGEVDGYVFVVGACMQEGSFIDRNECAAGIRADGPVTEVRAR
ncbi:hypothetical protein [Roseitalea porphyridii]